MIRYLAALGLCFVLFATAYAAEPKLTPEQKKELQLIAAEFRKAKSPEARVALIDQAAQIDAAGVEPLAEVVVKELQKDLAAYRQQYMKAAGAIVVGKASAESLAEIAALREKVLALKEREDLSKEMIVEVGDPGLVRLKELILINRRQVVGKAPELQQRRAALATLGQQWEACAKYLQSEESGEAPSFSKYLAKEEEIATALAMPMEDSTRQVLAANAQLAPKLDPEEARCILDLNLTRNLLGLKPVAIDVALVACARDHSADMDKMKFFSHESPIAGKKSFLDRARNFNTSASGENIAAGVIEGAAANRMWWHSPGHHKNMLGDHKRVGVGRSGRLWTEMFGG